MPDLTELGNASGWAVAMFVCLLVITAFLRGDIVARATHKREMDRGDMLDDRIDKITDTVKEQTGHLRTLIALQEKRNA